MLFIHHCRNGCSTGSVNYAIWGKIASSMAQDYLIPGPWSDHHGGGGGVE